MPLRTKWIICMLLFVLMLGLGARLNRMFLEDRPRPVIRAPLADEPGRGYSSLGSEEVGKLPANYRPREYVRIVHRER